MLNMLIHTNNEEEDSHDEFMIWKSWISGHWWIPGYLMMMWELTISEYRYNCFDIKCSLMLAWLSHWWLLNADVVLVYSIPPEDCEWCNFSKYFTPFSSSLSSLLYAKNRLWVNKIFPKVSDSFVGLRIPPRIPHHTVFTGFFGFTF